MYKIECFETKINLQNKNPSLQILYFIYFFLFLLRFHVTLLLVNSEANVFKSSSEVPIMTVLAPCVQNH